MNLRNKRYFTGVTSLALAYVRRFFRDKIALFFTFIFPIMFLLVFGALNRNDGGPTFDVAYLNNSQTEFSRQFSDEIKKIPSLKIQQDINNLQDAKEQMGRGEIDSILELPAEFGQPNAVGLPGGSVNVYFEEASPQTGQTLAAIVQGGLDKMNQNLTGTAPPLTVTPQSTATANLSSFDYVFSGLLGFTILSISIFGVSTSFPAEKKTGVFRRLQVAPIGASQLIFANGLAFLFSTMLSLAAMYLVALFVFDFNMRGNYFDFIVFSLVGTVTLFGFGLAIGGWAKNENQAAPLSNLVGFPMMFLSGVFFPRFLMPEWLQGVTAWIPLSPVVDGLRMILTEGKGLLDLGVQIGILALWAVVIYTIAIKVFRWE